MTTMHANSPRDAMSRIEALVGMAGVGMEPSVVRNLIVSAFDIVVHVARAAAGDRKISTVCEVVGIENASVQLREVDFHAPDDPAGGAEFVSEAPIAPGDGHTQEPMTTTSEADLLKQSNKSQAGS